MDDYSRERALEKYLELQSKRPELFRSGGAESIDILTDRSSIEEAQNAAYRCRQARQLDVSDVRAGLLGYDPYMLILRDPVRFPDGTFGLYNRIVEGKSVAVLPMLGNRPVLVRIFRHGLRDWSLEFPRGGCDINESPQDAARRELREEIGADAIELISLGGFTPGGSSLSIYAELFVARIEQIGNPDRADGISEILPTEIAEVEAMIRDSRIIDGFTLSTFLRARLAGLV